MAPMEKPEALSILEQKILRAAEVVAQLRRDRDAALEAAGDTGTLREKLAETTRELEAVRAERDSLRADKETVRTRLEKLLEQIDAISAS